MSLKLLTAPSELITLSEARLHLRIDAVGGVHPDDNLVKAFVLAATGEIDGADGWLGRALVTQSWRYTLDHFPCGRIRIPLPPLQTVENIKYIAPDGTLTTLSSLAYRVLADETPGVVEPIYGTSWPSTRCETAAVRIEFTAGYGVATEVPEAIKSYVKLRLGQFYNSREATVVGAAVSEQPWVKHMLEGYRVRSNYP